MQKIISGIQQIGIGNKDVHTLWTWYRKAFGMDVKIFEEAAEAPLMIRYTNGEVHKRNAVLAMNMQGGGGFEIWQFTSRTPQPPKNPLQIGDLGINICKLKTKNVEKAYAYFRKEEFPLLTEVTTDLRDNKHFFTQDPEGNIFEVVQANSFFGNTKACTAGVYGAIIGVSDMDAAIRFYRDTLDHTITLVDQTAHFPDLFGLPGGEREMRRVVLQNGGERKGAFAPLLGNSQIELIQVLDRKPNKIYEDRYWGDLGFIHLCFDIRNMDVMMLECEAAGHPFTVDSANSFDMGEAAGRFAYVEDPDGTLIEFVETHKVPVVKKIGWYLNLMNREPEKPLPTFVLKALGLNRVK